MDSNLTELVFVLDRSGSMSGLESDTIGGFNGMLAKQKAEPGECRLTTVLFDDRIELLHDRLDIRGVSELTARDYYVRGATALLDAVGAAIQKIVAVQTRSGESVRAGKVLFVITTDGMENSSRDYSHGQIKKMIEHQKEENSWEFLFLGANIDAVSVASRIGIGRDRAQSYYQDSEGVWLNYQSVSSAASHFRAAPMPSGCSSFKNIKSVFSAPEPLTPCQAAPAIPPDWNKDIDRHYKSKFQPAEKEN